MTDIEDVTPPDSCAPVILDTTPREPAGEPAINGEEDPVRQIIKMKIDHGIALTEEEIALIAGGA